MTHSLDVLRRLSGAVPAPLAERAAAFAGPPADPVASASVVLLRDGADGLETYLLHRHARMVFAASMVVFPGGRVDPADGAMPGAVLRCAVRETAEETGVLLEPAHLRRWAHWITPEPEPRRYDTEFFVAELPADQLARDISGETDSAQWWRPADALTAERDGSIGLMPPTLSILLELAELGSVAEVLVAAEGRQISSVLPRLEETADGWRFRYPRPEEGLQ